MRPVALIVAQQLRSKVRHFFGMPPELAGDVDSRQPMPRPYALLIETKIDGVFLFRITADGQFAGDTWHQSITEAQEQASFEFEDCVSDWTAVPDDVEDPVAFCLARR